MIIKKNTHYARPLQPLKKLLGIRICKSRKMSCEVVFTDSCRYNVGKDQSDIYKLFGFSSMRWIIGRYGILLFRHLFSRV